MKTLSPSFKSTSGAMSVQEGIALANLATIVPDVGICIECGSHAGKSAIAIAIGFDGGPQRHLDMVDPLFEDEEFAKAAKERVEAVSPSVIPALWPTTSLEAMESLMMLGDPQFFAFAFLDSGDHDCALVRSEFDFLKTRMVPGGIIALHDVGNYQGPLMLWQEAQNEGFENVPIPWDEIKEFCGPDANAGNNSWHCCDSPAPCFLAALRKV